MQMMMQVQKVTAAFCIHLLHFLLESARSSKRADGLIHRIALDQCRDPERYRTRVSLNKQNHQTRKGGSMKRRSTKQVRQFQLKVSSYGNSYYIDRIAKLEKVLKR